jgi:glycine dehydrogenase subunit 2
MTTMERTSGPARTDIGAKLTFDIGRPGRRGVKLPEAGVPTAPLPDDRYLRADVTLPELSQNQVIRYFLGLSQLNYGVDTGFYPLGSCTMKYNPKVNEDVGRLPGFAMAHPLQPAETVQGALDVLFELQSALAAITGMDAVGLAPAAGAQGEFSGILMIKSLLEDRGEGRRKVLIPDRRSTRPSPR